MGCRRHGGYGHFELQALVSKYLSAPGLGLISLASALHVHVCACASAFTCVRVHGRTCRPSCCACPGLRSSSRGRSASLCTLHACELGWLPDGSKTYSQVIG